MTYFQGGEFVELLSAQGKSPAAAWKLQGKISKTFDKGIKGNAFQLDGSSETKMQLPKAASSSLGLAQRFVVLQLLVPFTRSFSVEICFSDFQKVRRRFVVASAFRDTTRTALHVQLPLNAANIPRDQWLNLAFDLQCLSELYFPDTGYRSMESICVGGSCRLKRIFTMKDAPTPSRGSQEVKHADIRDIPRQFVFSATQRGANGSTVIPTLYFAMAPSAGMGALSVTGIANSKERKRSQTAPTKTKLLSKATRPARPATRPVGSATQEPSATSRSDNNPRAPTRPQQRLRTPAKVSLPSTATSRPQSRHAKSPEPEKPSASMPTKVSHELDANQSCDIRSAAILSDRESELRASPGDRREDTNAEPISDPDCPSERELAHTLADSEEIRCPSPRLVSSSHGASTNSGARSGVDRQAIMGEIEQQIAALEREDELAEERHEQLFLRHTSVKNGEYHLKQLDDELGTDCFSDSDGEGGEVNLSVSWRREQQEHVVETFRMPTRVIQNDDASVSGSDAEQKSIFEFHKGAESQTHPSLSSTRLFDFGSLLQDAGQCFSLTLEPDALKETVGQSPAGKKSTDPGVMAMEKDEEDLELLQMLAAKRSARQQIRDAEVVAIPTTADDAYDEIHEATDSGSEETMELEGSTRKSKQDQVTEFNLDVSTTTTVQENHMLTNVNLLSTERINEPSNLEEGDQTHQSRAAETFDINVLEDDDLSIDLTNELGASGVGSVNACDEFERSSSHSTPATELPLEHDQDSHHVKPPTPGSRDSDSSFDFADLVEDSESSDAERHEDDKADEAPSFTHTSQKVEGVPIDHSVARPNLTTSHSSPRKGNQCEEQCRATPRSMASITSPQLQSGSAERGDSLARRSGRSSASTQVDLSSSFSSRRLQKLLESTDWAAELTAHASTFPTSTSRSALSARGSSKPQKPARYRSSNAGTRSSQRLTPTSPPRNTPAASIELVYDPKLRCYHDPVENKYYALAE